MKRLLVNFILVFSVAVISSCAFMPGISFTKRNFSDGYYLDFISGKNNKPEVKPETNNEDNLIEQPADVPIKILPENNLADPSPEKTGFSVLQKNNNEIPRKAIRKANSPNVNWGAGELNKNIFSKTTSSIKSLLKIPARLAGLTLPTFPTSGWGQVGPSPKKRGEINSAKTSHSIASVNHEGGEIIWTSIGILISYGFSHF